MSTQEELTLLLEEKIGCGKNLVMRLKDIKHLDGALKLQRKILQEIEFLKRLQKSKNVKIEQLSCSNLRHLGAMVDCATRNDIVAVCKVFHINDENKLTIDIVSNGGRVWTKVIARNPKSLSALSSGKSSYGARTILDQANDYIECAKLYPCMYQSPMVVFEFVSGIEETLANKLKAKGVIVYGDILPDSKQHEESGSNSDDYDDSEEELDIGLRLEKSEIIANNAEEHVGIDTLNLDVTTMMAYVSNMTNGHCYYVFKQDVLTQQSQWEAQRPVKPVLQELFKGKKLICCETAWNDFEKIVNTLGGPMEKKRTAELKAVLTIYADDHGGKKLICCETAWNDFEKIVNTLGGPMEKKRTAELKAVLTIYADDHGGKDDYPRKNLKVRGNVRLRSKIIFNFGHRMKALTVSANEGFVRAASQQGVTYAAFIHESRALTESKEASATLTHL